MKRTRLKRRSPKYAAANRKAARERAEYLREQHYCEICRYAGSTDLYYHTPLATEVHHLAGRNSKCPAKYERRANWQALCAKCHRYVTDWSVKTAQLCWTCKLFCDPDNADLQWLAEVKPTRFRHLVELDV